MLQIDIERNEKPSYRIKEAFKQIRTNILFSGINIKVICHTSSLPNEGKTSVSFNLAISFAESNKKVLFIIPIYVERFC